MQNLPLVFAALACPVGMGVMMFFMMRPGAKQQQGEQPAQQEEIAQLRRQVAELRDQQHPRSASASSFGESGSQQPTP